MSTRRSHRAKRHLIERKRITYKPQTRRISLGNLLELSFPAGAENAEDMFRHMFAYLLYASLV